MNDAQQAALADSALDEAVHLLELFLIENKFMGLFSFLFGVSFWLFLDRAASRGASGTALFYRRIGWLFFFGALHGWLLWCFDILRFYALWALVLPLFVRMPPRRLLAVALCAAVLAPAIVAGIRSLVAQPGDAAVDYDALALAAFSSGGYAEMLAANWAYDWHLTESIGQVAYQTGVFGRLLLGLYAARTLDLARLERHRPMLVKVLLAGAVIGAVGNAVFAAELFSGGEGFLLPFLHRLLVESGHLGFTLAFAAGLALLAMRAHWMNAVASLAPLGRVALSAYLLQTVFGLWLFYGFMPGPNLMGELGPAQIALVWLAGCALQIVLARAWLSRFRFGPAEWLWRSLTYWRVQPMIHLRAA